MHETEAIEMATVVDHDDAVGVGGEDILFLRTHLDADAEEPQQAGT